MSDPQLGVWLFGVIAALRAKNPRLDGWPVIGIALTASALIAWALSSSVEEGIKRALVIAGTATGTAAGLSYGAKKLGAAIGPSSSVRVDAISAPVTVNQSDAPVSVGTRGET